MGVLVKIYDLSGRLVREIDLKKMDVSYLEKYPNYWDGCDQEGRRVPPGPYFHEILSDDQFVVRRLKVFFK